MSAVVYALSYFFVDLFEMLALITHNKNQKDFEYFGFFRGGGEADPGGPL